jgi:hypothetical protein
MKQRQIIFGFLFPTRQYAAKAVHPAMCPLYNPASSFEASLMFNSLHLLATRTYMSSIAKLFYQISYLTRVITFIQAHPLRNLLRGLRAFYWDTFYGRLCHFAVMPISSINRQANRYSGTLSKQTAFNTLFGPVRRVWAGFFPRQVGPLSWHHPSIAMTSQYLLTHHSLPEPFSRASEKLRLGSIAETASGLCCLSKYRFHSKRSIDNRFSVQKESRPLRCDLALSVGHRQNDEYSDVLVSMARSFPIIRLKSCIYFLLSVFSFLNPFKGIIAFDYIGYSWVIRIGS